MAADKESQSTSTELTGGTGFTYEDLVVAYYLAALLLEGHAAGVSGVVVSVAVQQAADQPMDDIIVELKDNLGVRTMALQLKRTLRISAAASNSDYLQVMSSSTATRQLPIFKPDRDAYGFITEHVAQNPLRSLNRLIEWARASVDGSDFARRFASGGSAAKAERDLRNELRPLTGTISDDGEADFYRHLIAQRMDGLWEGGSNRASILTQLKSLVANDVHGAEELLFDRLCRIARNGAGQGKKWTRPTLLQQLCGVMRLRCAPSYFHDIQLIQRFSLEGLADVIETIGGCHIDRTGLKDRIAEHLTTFRLVNITGLPGCGKSAVLKQVAKKSSELGPILFLKSDRLQGSGWSAFASGIGLVHSAEELLAEIGASGTPILFIDGIDRVRPDQKGVITDLLRTIERHESLSHWRVLATSRDQGLEPYRAWFPSSFYQGTGIGDIAVSPFSDVEAAQLAADIPALRTLLIGSPAIQEIARRPFFAAVLARGTTSDSIAPQTENDLITAWWARAGHDAAPESAELRRRAIIDLAEAGVRGLGKNIRIRNLKDATIAQLATLKADLLVREDDDGASCSFTHDIFFEWAFFRLLIDLSSEWYEAILAAGEPPLLARVVGLLAQQRLGAAKRWTEGYRLLEAKSMRPQWLRAWVTAPPFSVAFLASPTRAEFTSAMTDADFHWLEKLLVWFQAEHTIPNPVVLQQGSGDQGSDSIRLAHLLGWPSDVRSWGRLIDWLLGMADALPGRLVPKAVELLEVWLNMFANHRNARTGGIVAQCSKWLTQLECSESMDDHDTDNAKWDDLGREAIQHLTSALRRSILRCAHAFPEAAKSLYQRAIDKERLHGDTYVDLMAYAHIISTVAPDLLVDLAKAEMLEELPQARFDREQRECEQQAARRKALRAIPESERTPKQQSALDHFFFPLGRERPDLENIGITRHHGFYTDPSALHEPFASLFSKASSFAQVLVRDLANQAVTGWRQVHAINAESMGTPLPLTLQFPWGEQTFWGDWRVYSWSQGQLAAAPLECAFLAQGYWAFQQIESGHDADDVIREIIQGSECYASLGLALVIALETLKVSETTLPLITCQRLWHHDIKRMVEAPSLDIDIFGLGLYSRLTGAAAQAKQFLKKRKSRTLNVRDLAVSFALTGDDHLRSRFKEALSAFPEDLPYEFEESRTHAATTEQLLECSLQWSGLGNQENYKRIASTEGTTAVTYESPISLAPNQRARLNEANAFLQAQHVLSWAERSLEKNAPQPDWDLVSAVAFAKQHDHTDMFDTRGDIGDHAVQSSISAIAACVIRFSGWAASELDWAWEVMLRVSTMREPNTYLGSRVPWHPYNHLIVALVHNRGTDEPEEESVRLLLDLTQHPLDDIAQFSFIGLLVDKQLSVSWIAAQLAMRLAIRWRPVYKSDGNHDHSKNQKYRINSFSDCVAALNNTSPSPLPTVPQAWEQVRADDLLEEDCLRDPDPAFDWDFAGKIFSSFPIEKWCGETGYRSHWQAALGELVAWTATRLMPPKIVGHRSRNPEAYGWHHTLSALIARSAVLLDASWVREQCLDPFLVSDDEALSMLSRIASALVTHHVLDSITVPTGVMQLLDACADRLVEDRAFAGHKNRDGTVYGNAMPRLIEALLFITVENAPGAHRFANGDWAEIRIIMPLVSKVVSSVGWSAYVMGKFLILCERAGDAYPLDDFIRQVSAALQNLDAAHGSWTGTILPARIAAVIQRLADKHYPLRQDQAEGLLRILDTLIDLGDRRSAALEQSETFREVQVMD